MDRRAKRIADLEARVFGNVIQEMETKSTALEQSVRDYLQPKTNSRFPAIVSALGIPFNRWKAWKKERQLEQLLHAIGETRQGYEEQIAQRESELGKYMQAAQIAGVALSRYHARLEEIETAIAEREQEYGEARETASRTDSYGYLAISQQLVHLREDRRSVQRKLRETASTVLETKAYAGVLEGLQQRACAVVQKLTVSEERLRTSLGTQGILAQESSPVIAVEQIQNTYRNAEELDRRNRDRQERASKVAIAIQGFDAGSAQFPKEKLAMQNRAMEDALVQRALAAVAPAVHTKQSDDWVNWFGEQQQKLGNREILLWVDGGRGIQTAGEGVWEDIARALCLEPQPYRMVSLASMECAAEDLLRSVAYVQQHIAPKLEKQQVKLHAASASVACIPELFPIEGKPWLPEPVTRRWMNSTQADLYNLTNIHARSAWEITKGKGGNIAIIDTGVDYTHKELEDRFGETRGYNFVDRTEDPMDDNEHGTHVGGIVAGKTRGVAPAAMLFALKVLNSEGFGSMANVLRAMDWVMEHNAAQEQQENKIQAVNLSLGSRSGNPVENQMCQALYQSGVAIIAAAGNETRGPSYPASYENVVSVAAVDRWNRHASFSNIWKTTDISAPGVEVNSSVPGNEYAEFSGTSMATPHIAGIAALAYSLQCMEPNAFESQLKKKCQSVGVGDDEHDAKYGAGLGRADMMVTTATARERKK